MKISGERKVNSKKYFFGMRVTQAIIAVLLVLPVKAFCQVPDRTAQLRLAQSLEQASEWENAVSVYEELVRLEPANFLYFDGLRRSYTQLKQFEKAVVLIQSRLRLFPGDVMLLAQLGGLYYESGASGKADSVWHVVLVLNPKNVSSYRIVAGQMIEHRLYDGAINVYREAQTATANEAVFSDELAALYSAMQRYGEATREFTKQLQIYPDQLSFVESRIASFTSRSEGVKEALTVVRAEVGRIPANIPFHVLLAWLLIEARDYDEGLAEYRRIDGLKKAGGVELFGFAQRLLQEKIYSVAAKGFRELIANSSTPSLLPPARFGLARSIEELSADTSSPTPSASPASEERPSYHAALTMYEAIAREYAGSEIDFQALFRMGIIKYERLFDLNGALEAFSGLQTARTSPTLPFDAALKIGEVRIAQNDLDGARKEYAGLQGVLLVQYHDQTVFRLAELDYFEKRFDSALVLLQQLTANLNTDLANDALQLQYFIQENKNSTPEGLNAFAGADLLMRQRKYSEALTRFRDVQQRYRGSLLIDDTAMKVAELQLLLQQPAEALGSLRTVAQDMPESILKDKAQMRIGEVYQVNLRDKVKAIEAYEQLLVKYPNSLYAEEARRRIRLLRGDSI